MARLGRLARAVGTAGVFVAALAGGALLHIDLPSVRRAVNDRLNRVLATALPGKIKVSAIGRIGTGRVDGVDATVVDPAGVVVLEVKGLRASIATPKLLASLASGAPLRIDLTDIAADDVDVNLDADDSGKLRLVRTFVAPPGPPGSGGPGRGVHLSIDRATFAHVAVHGHPSGALAVDADVADLGASLDVDASGVTIGLERAKVTARGVAGEAAVEGSLAGSLALPSSGLSDLQARARWRGSLGTLHSSIDAAYAAGKVDAEVELPHATPEALSAFWPACPFTQPVRARVEAHGTLPELDVDVSGGAETGSFAARGVILLLDEPRVAVHLDAHGLDPHAFSADGPTGSFSPSIDVEGTLGQGGAFDALALLDLPEGVIASQSTPPARAALHLARGTGAGAVVSGDGTVSVREPGAPTEIAVHLGPHGSSSELTFDVRAAVPRLDKVPRVGLVAQGEAALHGRGTFDLGSGRLDSQLDATVGGFGMGAIALDRATVSAHASGPPRDLTVDADLQGSDFFVGLLRFDDVKAHVQGPLSASRLSVTLHAPETEFHADATVSATGGGAVRDLEASLQRGEHEARARAKLVSFAGKTLRIDDGELEGLGAPVRLSLLASPAEVTVSAHGRAIDLERIAKLLGTNEPLHGKVALDVEATVRPDSIDGRVAVDVRELDSGSLRGGELHLETTLSGRTGSGKLAARLGDVGSLEVTSNSLSIGPGSPLEAPAWRGAWGSADITGHADLAKLVAWLAPEGLPVRDIAGVLDVKGHLARDSGEDMSPDVDVMLKTKGLAADGPPDAPWQLRGVDGSVHVHVDGQTAATSVGVQVADGKGPLVTLDASSATIPYGRLLRGELDVAEAARTTAFDAKASLPSRDLGDLPALLGTKGAKGDLAASLTWTGSPDQPTLDLHATLGRGHVDPRLLAIPLDLDLVAHYDGSRATAKLTADSHSKAVLAVDGSIDARATDVLDGLGGAAIPWTGSLHTTLSGFPLQSLAALDDRQVRGRASGTVALDGLHDDARASVDLSLDGLEVGDLACKNATLKGSYDGKTFTAAMRVDEKDGWVETHARAGARWGAANAPTLDASQPVDASITARQFRASLLLPFVSTVFTQLDGRIDGDARVAFDPATKTVQPQGKLTLSGGVFELASVGGEFHDATATVSFTPDGVVKLDPIKAKGLSGEIDAAASGRVDGRGFAGARGVIQVASRTPLPLVVDGVQVGMFDGHIDVDVERATPGPGYDVTIGVPQALVQLPVTTTHTVQTLGGLEGAHVGSRDPKGAFVPATPEEATPSNGSATPAPATLRVSVALGKDVEVKRGTDLDVHIEGTARFVVSDQVHATGQLRLSRGQIQVQGKTFALDSATVTFVDDPTNPQVVLTASWSAPDGTIVYADFVGPLKTGKVTLRSEPAHTQNEILSLILFGTTDQQSSASQGGSPGASTAAGAAGGAATAPINRVLDNLGLAGGVTTKIDTSQTTPRPEVEVQIARDVSIQVAWVLGVPPPGTNPDTTLLTLDWRFLRSWSVETTVGNAGTSILDLVWQHRY